MLDRRAVGETHSRWSKVIHSSGPEPLEHKFQARCKFRSGGGLERRGAVAEIASIPWVEANVWDRLQLAG